MLPSVELIKKYKKEKETMKSIKLTAFAIFFGTLFTLTRTGQAVQAQAQTQTSTKTTPVTVTNTTANPIPVTGGVSVTNVPTVKLDSSANTVKLDFENNRVQVYGNPAVPVPVTYNSDNQIFLHNWADTSIDPVTGLGSTIKALVCVTNNAPNAAGITVFAVMSPFESGFLMDQFSVNDGKTVCKPYDTNGASITVAANANGNTTGRVRIGVVGLALYGR
jgi:hypothetical protein